MTTPVAGLTLNAIKYQRLAAQTQRELIQNELIRNSLARVEDVLQVYSELQSAIKSHILGYPSTMARLVLGKEDYDEVVRILTEQVHKLLNELAEMDIDEVNARNRKVEKYPEKAADNIAEVKPTMKPPIM